MYQRDKQTDDAKLVTVRESYGWSSLKSLLTHRYNLVNRLPGPYFGFLKAGVQAQYSTEQSRMCPSTFCGAPSGGRTP